MIGLLVLLTGVGYWRDRRRQAFTLQMLEEEAGELVRPEPGLAKPLALTASGIVADNQRVAVEHYRLEATVRTGDQACLFPEVGKIEHHRSHQLQRERWPLRVPGS